MADFVLTQTDAQVQSVLNDAQDAQGAGAQTTLTTEYVMLKDTSGRYHKILKSSLTEACRNVLASLLVNNDKGQTISQIPAIASGDFGSITPANLASVLGGAYINISKGSSVTVGRGIYVLTQPGLKAALFQVLANDVVILLLDSTDSTITNGVTFEVSNGSCSITVTNNATGSTRYVKALSTYS